MRRTTVTPIIAEKGEMEGVNGEEVEGGDGSPSPQPDTFPRYTELPEVARIKVLSNLSSPEDKLNLIKAIPSEGQLMRWDRSNLELIFPMMMKRGVLDLASVRNLSMVNADIGRVVKTYFEPRGGMDTFFNIRSMTRNVSPVMLPYLEFFVERRRAARAQNP